jgi:hypothetical protein
VQQQFFGLFASLRGLMLSLVNRVHLNAVTTEEDPLAAKEQELLLKVEGKGD